MSSNYSMNSHFKLLPMIGVGSGVMWPGSPIVGSCVLCGV